jgi:hypothetical protein
MLIEAWHQLTLFNTYQLVYSLYTTLTIWKKICCLHTATCCGTTHVQVVPKSHTREAAAGIKARYPHLAHGGDWCPLAFDTDNPAFSSAMLLHADPGTSDLHVVRPPTICVEKMLIFAAFLISTLFFFVKTAKSVEDRLIYHLQCLHAQPWALLCNSR